MVEEQPEDDNENIDLVLLNGQPRSVRKKAPSKCNRCGSFEHTLVFPSGTCRVPRLRPAGAKLPHQERVASATHLKAWESIAKL